MTNFDVLNLSSMGVVICSIGVEIIAAILLVVVEIHGFPWGFVESLVHGRLEVKRGGRLFGRSLHGLRILTFGQKKFEVYSKLKINYIDQICFLNC